MLEMMPLRVSNFIFFWVSMTPDPSRRVHCFATYPACYASIIQFICLLGSHHTSTALAINNLFSPREQLKSFFSVIIFIKPPKEILVGRWYGQN